MTKEGVAQKYFKIPLVLCVWSHVFVSASDWLPLKIELSFHAFVWHVGLTNQASLVFSQGSCTLDVLFECSKIIKQIWPSEFQNN